MAPLFVSREFLESCEPPALPASANYFTVGYSQPHELRGGEVYCSWVEDRTRVTDSPAVAIAWALMLAGVDGEVFSSDDDAFSEFESLTAEWPEIVRFLAREVAAAGDAAEHLGADQQPEHDEDHRRRDRSPGQPPGDRGNAQQRERYQSKRPLHATKRSATCGERPLPPIGDVACATSFAGGPGRVVTPIG